VGIIDRENVIKGMEQFRADLKPFCGNHADWERFDAGLSMLKGQEKRIKLLEHQLETITKWRTNAGAFDWFKGNQ